MTPVGVSPGAAPILRSQRVFLRPVERDEMGTGVEWFSDPVLTEGLNARAPMSLAAEERWFEDAPRQQGQSVWHFSVCLREDGRAIGFTALVSVDHVNGSTELIIGIGDRASRDKGYGTEVMGILRPEWEAQARPRSWAID